MELTNKQMQNIEGGIAWGVIAAIASATVFFIGVFSGYTNPTRCNN